MEDKESQKLKSNFLFFFIYNNSILKNSLYYY